MISLYSGIIPIIKQAAIDAVNSTQPLAIVFGKVVSEKPLKVQVTPKLVLGANNLVVPEHLTKRVFEVNAKGETKVAYAQIAGECSDSGHRHNINGEFEITFDDSLKKNDDVILLRIQGGDKYLVLDRAVNV